MKFKKLVAFFLVMTMTAGAMPSLVFADENEGVPAETKVVESSEPESTKPSKPAETKPEETKPAESKPAETKPEETKPEETKPAESKPAETKPEESQPVETKPAESKTEETTEAEPPKSVGEEDKENEEKTPESDANSKGRAGQDGNDGYKKGDVIFGNPKTESASDTTPADNDKLFNAYVEKKLNKTPTRLRKSSVGSGLTGYDKQIYDSLASQIKDVADGKKTSTEFALPLTGLTKTSWTEDDLGCPIVVNGQISEDAMNAAYSSLNLDIDAGKINKALLADFPYELYWYNKTADEAFSIAYPGIEANYNDSGWVLSLTKTSVTVKLKVAQGYASDTYTTDSSKMERVNTAISNAALIVEAAKNKSDYEKMVYYRQEICSRVAYNNEALAQNYPFGDPWQLISVFDNDSNTDVVCEGYSKAFKYLCDQTSFKNNISCITVTGTMSGGTGSGLHMWNIVTMDDGKNYLVDVTNCDGNSIGAPDLLFLKGYASGNVNDGYIFNCNSSNVSFVYDSDTKGLYSNAQLTISGTDYNQAVVTLVVSGNSVFRTSASAATVRFNASADGTYYYVVNSSSAAPSAADIKAASNGVHGSGTAAAGTNSIGITGMSSGKQYCHIALFDGENSSNVLTLEMLYDFCYYDDFNGYGKDTMISSGKTPFTVLYVGSADADQKIITSVQKDGTNGNVLQLQGRNYYASNVQCNIAPDNKQFLVIEVSVKAVSGTSPGGVVIGSSQGGSKTLCVHCLHNGTFQYGVGDVSEYVDSTKTYSIGNWYELKVVLDRTNNVFYSFVDGKMLGYGLATSALTPDWFVLSAGNVGANTTYYDNIRMYTTDTYEIVKTVGSWADLEAALKLGGNVKLTQDIADTSNGGQLVIPEKITTVLDLNGYVIDRKGNGNLFWVAGNLTIKDSSPDRTHSTAISYRNPVSGDTVVVKGGILTGATNCAIICTYGGSITMNGGTVCGNKSSNSRGGAVDLSGSVFNMYGGALVNNYTPESGGAVRVYENSTFNMYGGTIAYNTADKNGGGIYLWNNQNNPSILNMSGGEINENVSGLSGAGVCVDSNGRLNISGTAKIKDNKKGTIENNVWGGIYVSGALEDEAKIGVSTYYDPAQNNPQQITFGGYNTYNNGEDPSKYFFSDKGFGVGLVTSGTYTGEVQLEFVINTWADLQTALNQGGTVKLTKDITAGAGDTQLYINKTVVLDLNGYIINRNLTEAANDGGVIYVDAPGNLTINDSRPETTHSPAIKYKDLTTGNDVVVKGGIITGGYNSSDAGGVYFKYSSGTINGGTIVGNKACGTEVFGNAGGIVIRSSTVTMNGGAICGNEAVYGDDDTVVGGVMLNDLSGDAAVFNITGGLITGNYTNSTHGSCIAGVFTYAGKINVSGNPKIYGNMKNGVKQNVVASNTTKGRVIGITGTLTDGASIGITTWRIPPCFYSPEDFTSGFSTYNPNDNPSMYFSLDDDRAIMVFDDATEAKVAWKFTITLSDDGNGSASVNQTDIYYGLHPTITVTPNTGYVFKEWQVLSGKATISNDNKVYVDAEDPDNPVTDIQIKAVFEKQKFTVTFVDGTNTLSTVTVVDGEKVSKPSDPVKDGYRFLGWYSDPEFDHPFVFDTAIDKETTIYASFVQEFTITVTAGTSDKAKAIAGETVTLTADAAPAGSVFDKWETTAGTVIFADQNSASTTFNMPAGNVEIKATYKVKSGTCGDSGSDLTWDLDYTTGTLTVSGTGNMANWGDADAVPWYKAKDSIKSVVIAEGVTSIGARAFNGYSNLAKVTIAGTVETIGYWAFYNCTNLERVELPEGVTTINAGAFRGCTGLTSIAIPESITKIDDNVFNGCTSLTAVTYAGTKDKWDNLVSIGSGNDSLTNATMNFAKTDNTLSVKGKTATVKYKKLRKKKQTLSVGKVISFTNRGQGTLTYVKVSGNKKISINSKTGAVTIKKKGLKKKKTYTVKVRVMASGNDTYKASSWQYVTFKIKVK